MGAAPRTQRLSVLVVVAAALVTACKEAPASDIPPASNVASRPTPTFTRDIAPILFTHCAPCHRPGQAAPFSLLSYADAAPRAPRLAAAVEARRMPPWLPTLDETPVFAGERRLSHEQIATVQQWAKEGAPEGAADPLPNPPVFTDQWELGTPDLVVTLDRPYILKPAAAGQHDVFRNVIMRLALPQGRFVRAVEFLPGPAPVVHHAVITIDRTRTSRRRDGADGQAGFDGMIVQESQAPDGHFIGWTPGRGPIVAPAGLQWRLEKNSDLVIQLHLLPGANDIVVTPTVGLYFIDAPPVGTPVMLKLGSKAIEIPAGAVDYAITDSYTLPVDIDLLSIYPHAHYLGKGMTADAMLPDGTRRRLLEIKQWSFHWQQDYRFITPLPLPRGTKLSMRYTYDNSAANRHNPHHPPAPVLYGPSSSDEMGDLWLQVLPHSSADASRLTTEFREREAVATVASAEMLVRHFPEDPKQLTYLGGSYAQVRRFAEAATVLEKALRLDPRSADAHNYLGGVRLAERRLPEVLAHFQRAAALAPGDEHMHFNLGNVLNAMGRPDDGAREFRRAVAINSDLGPAHHQIGIYLATRGRTRDALVFLRRAVELMPESAEVITDLASVLAESGQHSEARALFERALALQPDYALARDNLSKLKD
jgi:tetratricopeptide (TPR) repeat protein